MELFLSPSPPLQHIFNMTIKWMSGTSIFFTSLRRMDKNDSAMTAHIVSMISGTHRKRHVPLDNRSLEICLQMARDGKTSKEIAWYSGQDIRSAQHIVKRALDIEEPNNIYDVKIERRGPKPLSDESLSQEIQSKLEADNSLTIKGIYCFNYRN